MMSNSSFIAQLAVYQTCRDIEAQIKLYTEYGFVEDAGYTATSGTCSTFGKLYILPILTKRRHSRGVL